MIDLSKEPTFKKQLSQVDLRDNQGVKYKYSAVCESQGFPGFLGEVKGKAKEGANQPRHVRLTEDLVFIPNDLAQEFLANMAQDLLRGHQGGGAA